MDKLDVLLAIILTILGILISTYQIIKYNRENICNLKLGFGRDYNFARWMTSQEFIKIDNIGSFGFPYISIENNGPGDAYFVKVISKGNVYNVSKFIAKGKEERFYGKYDIDILDTTICWKGKLNLKYNKNKVIQ